MVFLVLMNNEHCLVKILRVFRHEEKIAIYSNWSLEIFAQDVSRNRMFYDCQRHEREMKTERKKKYKI